jgi:hypothetical protein
MQVFVHYSSFFWRKTGSKRASSNCFGSSRSRARAGVVRRRVLLLGPHAEVGLGPLVRASWTPLRRTAFLPHYPCATRRVRHGQAAPTVPPPVHWSCRRTPPHVDVVLRAHAATSASHWRARTAFQTAAFIRTRAPLAWHCRPPNRRSAIASHRVELFLPPSQRRYPLLALL